MCGVFGFVSEDGRFNMRTMERIAANTMTRGPHAFGFAWIDAKDRLRCFKSTGRIVDHLGLLAMAKDAKMLIGHCRWATQGRPENNLNNHPHPVDGGWLVHNGVIPGYRAIVRAHELYPVSDCDSEVLGLLVEQGSGTMLKRCVKAAKTATASPLVLLGLWARPNRLIAVRRGNPLSMGLTSSGWYIASLPDELPGKVETFRNEEAVEFV